MKIEINVSEDNESTAYPWWMIVRPTRNNAVENVVFAVTGPFFSREEAELELRCRRYDYGPKAIVWCASGYRSGSYRAAIDARIDKDIHDASKCL